MVHRGVAQTYSERRFARITCNSQNGTEMALHVSSKMVNNFEHEKPWTLYWRHENSLRFPWITSMKYHGIVQIYLGCHFVSSKYQIPQKWRCEQPRKLAHNWAVYGWIIWYMLSLNRLHEASLLFTNIPGAISSRLEMSLIVKTAPKWRSMGPWKMVNNWTFYTTAQLIARYDQTLYKFRLLGRKSGEHKAFRLYYFPDYTDTISPEKCWRFDIYFWIDICPYVRLWRGGMGE